MPAINPGQPVAPGVASPGTFPVWGIGGGTPGSSAGWKIVEAKTAAQQYTYEQQGYLVWFSTKAAAQAEISSESSAYGSGSPKVLTGLSAIGDFFGRLSNANTWLRVGEVILGAILVAVGIARITHAQNFISAAVKTAGVAAI